MTVKEQSRPVDAEQAAEEMRELKAGDPPTSLDDWPDGPAKYLTYGSGEDEAYGAGRPPPSPTPRADGMRGASRTADRRDKPASALAHGPAKCSDIERVRRDADDADARSVSAEEVSVARHRQRVSKRTAEHEQDARTSPA